jgi:predicted nucleic acid-binding protein
MKEITGRPSRWGGLFVSSFIEVEVVSAICKSARNYPPQYRHAALAAIPNVVSGFRRELRLSRAFTIVKLDDAVSQSAMDLLMRMNTREFGAGDAIHLASTMATSGTASPLVFVTADAELGRAAKDAGLEVFDPNYEDVNALRTKLGRDDD